MAQKGTVLTNPIDKDSFEFIETAASTNGASVKVKAVVYRKGELVPNHFHVLQDETFEVLDGELSIWYDGKVTTLKPGEKLTLPKNVPHNHYNNTDLPVTYYHTTEPALDFEYLLETLQGLASDGKGKNGKFGLLQELVILKYLDSKAYLADIPVGVQNLLMNTIAPIARLLGYRAAYKKYSGIEK